MPSKKRLFFSFILGWYSFSYFDWNRRKIWLIFRISGLANFEFQCTKTLRVKVEDFVQLYPIINSILLHTVSTRATSLFLPSSLSTVAETMENCETRWTSRRIQKSICRFSPIIYPLPMCRIRRILDNKFEGSIEDEILRRKVRGQFSIQGTVVRISIVLWKRATLVRRGGRYTMLPASLPGIGSRGRSGVKGRAALRHLPLTSASNRHND